MDIEDLTGETAAPPRLSERGVKQRHRPKAETISCGEACSASEDNVPGAHAVYVKTYGCSHNSSDSEYMCGLLQQYGYRIVAESEREAADLWLINSCTVKNPSEEHMVTDLKRGRALGLGRGAAGRTGRGGGRQGGGGRAGARAGES